MTISAELLGEAAADVAAYEAFLAASPAATLYHTISYRRLIEATLACRTEYLVAREDGRIRGCLPLAVAHGPDGDVINSLPFFGSYGAILADAPDVHARLSAAWADRIGRAEVGAATMIENPFADGSLADEALATHFDQRLCQVTRLEGLDDADAFLRRIDGSSRRNIKKAKLSGCAVTQAPDALDFLERVHRDNMRTIGGRAKPRAFFEALPKAFRPGIDYTIYVCSADGQPVSALLVFFFARYVEYFIPVTVESARELQPMALILSEAMQQAARDGRSVWNWGGTWLTQDGVYRFKRKWGAEDRPYRYLVTVRNRDLLVRDAADLQSAYPGFFVVPFAALASVASTGG